TASNSVMGTIAVGVHPTGIAITPDGLRAYVVNQVSRTVSVIDLSTDAVIATIGVGDTATKVAITPDGSRAYVTNQSDNTVSVIATATNAVIDTIAVGSSPVGIAISALSPADTMPPSITAVSVDKPVLWPPDHRLVTVTVNYQVSDNEDASPDCTLSVASNEPINGTGDGDTAPDWEVEDAHHVRLRAERAGKGEGRVYRITITCTDNSNNASSETVMVRVPKNQKK
ncbi:MAG TPA: hypothetical protein VFQ92_02130, partial [Blastocatellia bacterium]|nr:hypothetical protein [Blastocatellia bacterium]